MNRTLIVGATLLLFTLNRVSSTAFGQGTAFTYQGRVTDNGTNFNGTGQFQFELVTSTNGQQATATAITGGVSPNEFLSSCIVGNGGSGYTTAPTVKISGGGGTGATAQANISGGMVTSITVLTPGSGYTSTPTITIAPPSTDYTTLWSNDGTSVNGSEPSSAVSVSVSQGLFTVILGNTTLSNMTAIPASVFSSATNLQLMIWFNDGVSGFAMLTPLQSLTPTPYAVTAGSVEEIQASQLTSIGNTNGGSGNFFVGSSGNAANSGSDNTANGASALTGNTTGGYNTANGTAALYSNTSGSQNTADGAGALGLNTSGSNNIALGYFAGLNITTGSSNIDIGNTGVYTDTNIIRIGSAQAQTFIAGVINGDGGGLINVSAAELTSIGNTNPAGGGNFFVGRSGNAAASGFDSTAIGVGALIANTSGSYNTAIGSGALELSVGGGDNTAIGYAALYSDTYGSYNTACGLYALNQNVIGNYNVAVGQAALGANTSGTENTANGYLGLTSNTSGYNNTADGYGALNNNTIGFENVADGDAASWRNTNGCFNTAIGMDALFYNMSGSNNIALGFLAGQNISGSSNIDIGNFGVAGESGIIRIGTPGTQTATYLSGTVYANGVALTSDRNAKENFTPVNPQTVLDKVAALPVTEWNYKTSQNVEHIGPMAQDFHSAFGLNGSDDKTISVVDEGGVALTAIKGLNEKLEEQSAENAHLKQENNVLAKRLDELEAEVKAMKR